MFETLLEVERLNNGTPKLANLTYLTNLTNTTNLTN